MEKFGTENPSKAEEVKKKTRETNLKKYGYESPSKSNIVKQHTIENNLEKYGVEYPNQLPEYSNKHIKKWKDTMIELYGSTKVQIPKYTYDELPFDSSWELAFYIYHKDKKHKIMREPTNFSYIKNSETHLYFPDFKVNGKYYEIKGDNRLEFYKNGKVKTLKNDKEKYKCMKEHNVILIWSKQISEYLNYVEKVYGKRYLNEFRTK